MKESGSKGPITFCQLFNNLSCYILSLLYFLYFEILIVPFTFRLAIIKKTISVK